MAEALPGLIALQGKAVTSDSIQEQECEASSLLLFFLRSWAPPALLSYCLTSSPYWAPTTNNNEELKKPSFPLTGTLHMHAWGPRMCTHPGTRRQTHRQHIH